MDTSKGKQGTEPEDSGDSSSKELPGFRERLGLLAEQYGSLSALAKKTDIPYTSLRHYQEKGEPPARVLVRLAQVCNVRLDWLATGDGPMQLHIVEDWENDFVQVPLYDVYASAGVGTLVDGEAVKDYLAFRKRWLQKYLRVNPAHLHLLFVVGDSMEPTLHEGDIMMVDTSDTALKRAGIYVIRIDGALYVKRLQHRGGDTIEALSDNERYTPILIECKGVGNEIAILGRVIWSGKKL